MFHPSAGGVVGVSHDVDEPNVELCAAYTTRKKMTVLEKCPNVTCTCATWMAVHCHAPQAFLVQW